jgi:hypothetical protein
MTLPVKERHRMRFEAIPHGNRQHRCRIESSGMKHNRFFQFPAHIYDTRIVM